MEQMTFQGSLKKQNYFEGWYYKHVTKDKKNSFIAIPGISLNEKDPHAFIQTFDTVTNTSYYFTFPKEDFHFQKSPFCIQIGENSFFEKEIHLVLQNEDITIKGDLFYEQLSPIQTSHYAPTIMGPFSYFPMQCSHGIFSMDHVVNGTLLIQSTPLDFQDGYGYIEKDYGTHFPKRYLWYQSNTPKKEVTDHKKVSLVCSIATVPIWKFCIRGYFCVFLLGDKEYRFSTYDMSKLKELKKKENSIYIIRFKKRDYELKIVIKAPHNFPLSAPENGQMKNTIYESLNAESTVTLKKLKKTIIKQRLVSGGFEDTYFI